MNKTLKLILIYTILFGVLTIGLFVLFILAHKSFIQYGDGYKQGYFWVVEVRQQLHDLAAGEGLHMWSWSKGLGMNVSMGYIIDPFMIIAALFPPGYIELGYTVANLFKMYCGGLVFLLFCKYVELDEYKCLVGSLCYTFSAWFIEVALSQSSLLMNAYLFPLLVLSVEWVYKKRNPLFFIIVVAYYMMRSFYFSYMSAIVIILYILLRYFAYNNQLRIKEYFINVGKFICYGICGCLMSFIIMLPYLSELQDASTESSTDTSSIMFDVNYYIGFGEKLIGRGITDDYPDIGLHILVLLLIPIAIKKLSKNSTGTIMTIILFAMMMFRFFCSMFNAFGYPTLRWSYTFIFFAVWAAMSVLDLQELRKKGNLILMAISLIVIAIWSMLPTLMYGINMDENKTFFIPWILFAGLILLLCVGFGRKKLIVLFTLGALVVGWNWSFYHDVDEFMSNNRINSDLKVSTQRVANQIKDKGFYRIDQVDGIRYHHGLQFPANENEWWRFKSIYLYDSKLPTRLFDYNDAVGNDYGHTKRVYVLSNDNRMGIDYLAGVRYFLGDDNKNGWTESDDYAGYGFAYYDTIDDVRIYKSRYDTSLGYTYDQCLSESEFMKLSRLEREQALMQAAVIPDGIKTETTQRSYKDMETDIKEIPYNVVNSYGASIEGNRITARTEEAYLELKVDDIEKSQLIVSFDNLKRTGSEEIKCSVKTDKLSQTILNDNSNQTIPGRCDYNVNLGYYDDYSGTIRITIFYPGEYTFDKLYVSAMSADLFDKYAKERQDSLYQITDYNEEMVKGTVDLSKDSIVYFSIPSYKNWDVYVDGVKQTRIDGVNIAFMGVEVPEGKHEVVLKYSYTMLKYAGAISLVGLLFTFLICIIYRHRRVQGLYRNDLEK